MNENLKSSQEDCFEKLQFFSIAIDESTDTTDTAQLAVFVRGIKENFYVSEEFVELIPLKTADSDTVSTYQVSLVQLVTNKKLEAFNKA